MKSHPIKATCIVGAGTMGKPITFHCALSGYEVWLSDCLDQALNSAQEYFSTELQKRIVKDELTDLDKEGILNRIHLTRSLADAVLHADLVIEAVPEQLELKREVFVQLDKICPDPVILATNSSSIPISAIETTTQRPDRVLNMHFYDPTICPLVELMKGTATSEDTLRSAYQFVRSLDLTPLIVRKESRGFILNRIWRVVKKECLQLLQEGIAAHEDIDRAWMIAWKTSLGPVGLMDVVGLDVVRDIEMIYYKASGDESDKPPQFLLDMIDRGELGVKSGRGFYTYPEPSYQDPSWIKGDKGMQAVINEIKKELL
jgi:3-hydroxybutyryl-CoA dehydrogenase